MTLKMTFNVFIFVQSGPAPQLCRLPLSCQIYNPEADDKDYKTYSGGNAVLNLRFTALRLLRNACQSLQSRYQNEKMPSL